MPSRPMNVESSSSTGEVQVASPGEDMPTRAMDEAQPSVAQPLSHREQDKLAAYRRDQAARAAAARG
jgi:hypothetical protein